jgi:hypothetical protein
VSSVRTLTPAAFAKAATFGMSKDVCEEVANADSTVPHFPAKLIWSKSAAALVADSLLA